MNKNAKLLSFLLALLLVLASLSVAAVLFAEEEGTRIVLFRIEGDEDIDRIGSSGANLLHGYPGFALVELTGREENELNSQGIAVYDRLPGRTHIYVNGYRFDFTREEPSLPGELTTKGYEPGVPGLYIVHTLGPVASDWRPTIENSGGQVLNYMHNHAYLVRMTPEAASKVEDLYFVDWVGFYHPGYKIQDGTGPGLINIGMFSGPSTGRYDPAALNFIRDNVEILSMGPVRDGSFNIIGRASSLDTVHSVAVLNDVLYISNYVEPELYDEMATQLVGGGLWFFDDEDDDPTTAYRLHGDAGSYMNQIGFRGDGIVIAVADTGLGDGTIGNAGHLDFTGRVIGGYSFEGGAPSWADVHGHGTHCAGSAAGDTHNGTGATVYGSYYSGQGSAPDAELYGIRIFNAVPEWIAGSDYYEIIQVARDNVDAHVHTNSWGAAVGGVYDVRASEFDAAVRGENMVTIVAAGNSGPGYTTVGAPGTAKNVITVGGSQNYNPDVGYNDPELMYSSSSRGWTADNRVKPDVIAPAQYVTSTMPGGGYGVMSGTSMATPAAAGAAAVTYEWYQSLYRSEPSPAMVRALLINTATDMGGNTEGTIPNRDEGWGIVDISKLNRPLGNPVPFYMADQEHVFTESLQENTHSVMVDRMEEPLKFSLVWTDKEAPGGTETGRSLINDLDLEVESPSGLIYRGNAFSDGWSVPGGNAMPIFDHNSDGWDDTNNVENVYIPADDVELGVYTVRVRARVIGDDAVQLGYNSQDYALVAYNALDEVPGTPPSVVVNNPVGGEILEAGTQQEISWTVTPGDDPIQYIHLAYSSDAGSLWTPITTITPGRSDSFTWDVPNVHSSECSIRVIAVDEFGRSAMNYSAGLFEIIGTEPAPPVALMVEHSGVFSGPIFQDDVEGGDLGYTTGQTSGASEWGIRTLGAQSGTHSWDFGNGNYNDPESGGLSWLITPEIDLTGASEGNLTFWHWRDFESATTLWDAGNLKISTDSVDGPWELITDPIPDYDGPISSGFSNPIEGEPGWGLNVGWTQVFVDLEDYLGETVWIRWDAGVDNWGTTNQGWRIDDIVVSATIADDTGADHNLISWDASPDENTGDISHYNLYRSESQHGPWNESTLVATVPVGSSTSYEYMDWHKGMADTVYWWYVVRAVGTNGREELNEEARQEPGEGVPPSITITSPEGGETWHAFTEETISWIATESDSPLDYVNLWYSIDAGGSWTSIDTGLDPDVLYTWNIPNVHSSEAMIRARVVDTVGRWNQTYSELFEIVGVAPTPPEDMDVQHQSAPENFLGFVIYDPIDPPRRSVWFEPDDPGTLNFLALCTASNFIAGADWVEDTWYGVMYDGGLYTIDADDGTMTYVGDTPGFHGLAYDDSTGILYANTVDSLYTVNPSDGSSTLVGGFGGPNLMIGIASDGNGNLYGIDLGADALYSIDPSTGTATIIGPLGNTINYAQDIAYDRNMGILYHAAYLAAGPSGLYTIDTDTGAHTLVDNFENGAEVSGFAIPISLGGDEHNLITWNRSLSDDVSHYNIYRSESRTGPWDETTQIAAVSGTRSWDYQYTDLNKGLADDIFWWYVVRAVGINGLEEQNEDAVQEPGATQLTMSISLFSDIGNNGWNFVSFNLEASSTNLVDILEHSEHGISGNYHGLMYYNSVSGEWLTYVPGRPDHYNNLHSWDHTMGIWIRVTADVVLTIEGTQPGNTSITLRPGWNMVGMPSSTAGNHGLPSEVTLIGYFDATQGYNVAYDSDPSTFEFLPRQGYWLYNGASENVVWTLGY